MLRKLSLISILSILILILLFSSGISAFSKSLNLGNVSNSINDNYAPGAALNGWINISLKDEPTDSLLTVFNYSVSIIDVLRINSLIRGVQYNCSVSSCNTSYAPVDSESSSTSFTLNSGEKKLVGLKIPAGSVESVSNLILNVGSSAGAGCYSPLKIDIGNEGIYDWVYNKEALGDYCSSENYGCYQTSTNLVALFQDGVSEQYCQYINVSAAPGFKVGANITGSGNANISFSIDDSHSCSVLATSAGKVSCDIHNLTLEDSQSLFVCMSQTSGTGEYKLYYDSVAPTCGESNTDFSIFVQPIKYSAPATLVLNLTNDQASFAGIVDQYLNEIYSNDCSNGCIIPISFYSNQNAQKIDINSVKLNYKTTQGLFSVEKVCNLTQSVSKINMGFTKLNLLGLGFNVSRVPKNYSATFKIAGADVLTKNINVLNLPIINEVYPLEVPAGAVIYFTAIVSEYNITNYKWDFGDNSSVVEVSSNHVSHKYNELKKYTIKLTAVNSFGESNKTFQVNVISPKNYLPIAIESYKKKVSDIRTQLNTYPSLVKSYLEKKLDLTAIDLKIATLDSKYRTANSTPEYIDIANSLLTINLPKNIGLVDSASGKFIVDDKKINMASLNTLTTENLEGTEDSIKKAILEWFVKSVSVDISSSSFLALYENSSVPLGSYFNVRLTSKINSNLGNVYAVIARPKASLEFGSASPSQTDLTSSTGILLDMASGSKTFDFIVLNEKIGLLDAPLYFSPPLSELSTGYNISICNFNDKCESEEDSSNCRADCRPWGKTILWLFVLIILFLIAYIACQQWYKRRYESYLFKDKNDLFNLIHFISNAEKQGLARDEIIQKLKEKDWHSEQIVYAYRKFKGERTGMLEIPLFGLFEGSKINREIDIRNKIGTNARVIPRPINTFIKQPTFFGKPIQPSPAKNIPVNLSNQMQSSQPVPVKSFPNTSLPVKGAINTALPSNNSKPVSPNISLAKSAEQKTLVNPKKEEQKKEEPKKEEPKKEELKK